MPKSKYTLRLTIRPSDGPNMTVKADLSDAALWATYKIAQFGDSPQNAIPELEKAVQAFMATCKSIRNKLQVFGGDGTGESPTRSLNLERTVHTITP